MSPRSPTQAQCKASPPPLKFCPHPYITIKPYLNGLEHPPPPPPPTAMFKPPVQTFTLTACFHGRSGLSAMQELEGEERRGGRRGCGTQKFVHQKWPKSKLSFSKSHSPTTKSEASLCGQQPSFLSASFAASVHEVIQSVDSTLGHGAHLSCALPAQPTGGSHRGRSTVVPIFCWGWQTALKGSLLSAIGPCPCP